MKPREQAVANVLMLHREAMRMNDEAGVAIFDERAAPAAFIAALEAQDPPFTVAAIEEEARTVNPEGSALTDEDGLRAAAERYFKALDRLNGAHEARLAVGTDWKRLADERDEAEAALRSALTTPSPGDELGAAWAEVMALLGDHGPDKPRTNPKPIEALWRMRAAYDPFAREHGEQRGPEGLSREEEAELRRYYGSLAHTLGPRHGQPADDAVDPVAARRDRTTAAPLHPDPLRPEDVDPDYLRGWDDAVDHLRRPPRGPNLGMVVLAAAGAAFVLGILVGHATAAPRSAAQPVIPTAAPALTSGAEGMAVASGNLAERPSTAPPVDELESAIESGVASFVRPELGDRYLALPEGPGSTVRICSDVNRCIVRTSTDAGPDLAMQRAGRVADLSFVDFRWLCRCDPWARGLLVVTIERAGSITPPPTETEP